MNNSRNFPKIEFTKAQQNNMLLWLQQESNKQNHHALVALGIFYQAANIIKALTEEVDKVRKQEIEESNAVFNEEIPDVPSKD
jgi:hypothetical protein